MFNTMSDTANMVQKMSLMTDVENLKKAALPEVRASIAGKISQYFNDSLFDTGEKEVAVEIIRLLARDAEVKVRQKLSESLKSNKDLPHEIAISLANDVDEVSIPMLEFSKILTEQDLIAIVRSTARVAKLLAVSRRDGITKHLSSELLRKNEDEVVVSLFTNKSAEISAYDIDSTLERLRNNGRVIQTLVNTGNLSLSIVEKLLFVASGALREQLIVKYRIPKEKAKRIIDEGRERSTLSLLDDVRDDEIVPANQDNIGKSDLVHGNVEKISQLVKHLYREGRLTQSLVLRSLCEGNIEFFEVGIARLAGIPTINARTLMRDGNPEAFESLCRKAKMPISAIQAMRIISQFYINESEAGGLKQSGNKKRIIEYIVSNGYDKTVSLMPYLMVLIGTELKTEDVLAE